MEVPIRAGTPRPAEFTLGVEEEYQLVDATTGALRSRATDVRREDWSGELIGEFQETQLEIGTPVCRSAAELESEIARLRFQVATTAAARGMAIVAAGAHPFSPWIGHDRAAGERYARIAEKFGVIAEDEQIFGMHVHIAAPADIDRIAVVNRLRRFLPHLLALSASSPFVEAADTGFASFRSISWRRWPAAGIPPHFASAAEYRRFVQLQIRLGTFLDESNVYWSLRPHARYPTLEFRVTDVCPRLSDAVAIAALARTLVFACIAGRLPDEPRAFSRSVEREIIAANEWNAARHGLDATVADLNGRDTLPMRTAVRSLLDVLMPAARQVGDAAALGGIHEILERGNAADRMRREYRERDDFASLVHWLVAETLLGTGLDRRAAQRDASGA